jgi:hypothetical protein
MWLRRQAMDLRIEHVVGLGQSTALQHQYHVNQPRCTHRRTPVNATTPVGLDEILVLAQGPGAVQNDTVTFGCKPVFVRVYRYGGHAWTAEVGRA